MKKTTKPEDLDHRQILKLPDYKKYSIIQKQMQNAKLDIINSIDIVPTNKKNTKLFSSMNYALLHVRNALRELECISE